MQDGIPDNEVNAREHLSVYSDSKWLRFVLHRLLTNALKYSESGRAIIVRAYTAQTAILLSVEDEDCGLYGVFYSREQ